MVADKKPRPAPRSWLAGKGPGADTETERNRRESKGAPRRRASYRRPGTAVQVLSPILRCQVPGCDAKCTVSSDELALGMPQLCDACLYER
jgi:hypothetical protein